jgi:uroporphyrinogen decarboxylase
MKAQMTPRERVMATLNHEEPDRVPLDLGQAAGDGIITYTYRKLVRQLGLGDRPMRMAKRDVLAVDVDEDVLRRFSIDFRAVRMGTPDSCPDRTLPNDSYIDQWGVVRTRPPQGYYYDITKSPFAKDGTISAIAQHSWPDPHDPGRYREVREKAWRIRKETEYAIVVDIDCSFFIDCACLRGFENFFSDLLINVDFAEALMDQYLAIKLAMAERMLEEAGEFADVVIVSRDDLGSTSGTIISPQLYRSLIWPRQKKTFDFFESRVSAKRFYHCDGAIYPLIDDFVELGVDILNPIQVSAKDMGDTAKLKDEFGDKLTFWGGIDTNYVLPYGSPDAVREEVRRRILDMAIGGGYVLCSVHNIQPDVPAENVVAMFDAGLEFGRYSSTNFASQ